MRHREAELLGPTDLGSSGTKIIDINLSDVISSIELIWRTKVVTVSDMLSEHLSCISKIEIVDGSDVLFSLSGKQAQSLAFYQLGYMPLNDISVVVDDYMTSVIPILFGRYQFDPDYALDPKKFTNPQIRVTFDEDAANTSVVVNELTVRANVFDEAVVTPMGFFMSKEIKAYTPAASSYEYTDLPTDYPYHMLMLRSYATDKNPFEVLDQIKLTEEHDKRVPYDLTGDEVFRKIVQPFGSFHERVNLNEAAGDAMALYLAASHLQVGNIDYDHDVIAANDEAVQIVYTSNLVTIAATVSFVPYLLSQMGYAPYGCFPITFGRLNTPTDFYDVTKLGHLQLITKGASAVGTSPAAEVVIQQIRM